jgi:predicted MPP superfamily phosphohydrolase
MTAPAPEIEKSRAIPGTTSESDSRHPGFTFRRMTRFILIVSIILLSVNAFVSATVGYFFGEPDWLLWQLIPAVLPVGFILTAILGFRFSNPLLRFIYGLSASWLGFLNFAFFAAASCWIIAGIAWLIGRPLPRVELASVLFGAAILAAAYGLINAAWLRVTTITVPLPNLPAAWQGHTIALVTDLHLGHLAGPRFLRRVIARLRSLRPEAVLIGGDMFDGSTVGLDRLASAWRGFSAPRGIYFVTGNHDEFAERGIYLKAVERAGIHLLNNEKVSVEGLQIVGVHDSEAGDPRELRTILRRARLDRNAPSILLAHRPVNLAVAEEEGVSLQLSGHTHGGQVWPWNLLVSRIYGRFAYGLHRLEKLLVYTSNGAGTWGPPLRVGTKSEIVLIRLERTVRPN